MKYIVLLSFSFFAASCLKTRSDAKEYEVKQAMQEQVTSLQRSHADYGNRISDLVEQIRHLNGKIEVLENQLDKKKSDDDSVKKLVEQKNEELLKRMTLLQEEVLKLENQIQLTAQEVQNQKLNAPVPTTEAAASSKKDHYEQAEDLLKSKEWKKAILLYQKYRDENSKGKHYTDATYKMGVCFQELNMKDEAKTFYQDVINNYPKSEEAKKAKIRMKGMKK